MSFTQRQCHGKTQKGKRCKNRPLEQQAFCAIHLKIPPGPPDLWTRIRGGIATAADIAKVVSAADIAYKVIEFVAKHHPIHFMHLTKQQADSEYWALAQLLSQGQRESYHDEVESSAPDWSEARRLYVAIRHICESGSVKGSDLQTFYDFDEWFLSLDDALQVAITGDEESRDSEGNNILD